MALASVRNLTPHIKSLERKRFISTANKGGKRFFLVHDPAVALQFMIDNGTINDDELFEINSLLSDLKQPPMVAAPIPTSANVTPINKAKGA